TSSQIVGVHKVPSHLSKEEFEAKYETLNNFLKLEIVLLQNDRFDQYLESYRCSPRESLVVVRGEIESAESYIAVQKKMEGVPRALVCRAERLHFAWILSKTLRTILASLLKIVFIYGHPQGPAVHLKEECGKRFIKFFENYSHIPMIRKNFVKWVPNSAVDDHIHRVGYPPPETAFTTHIELETWENVVDFQNKESFKPVLAAKRDFDFNTNANVFTADLKQTLSR
ncbi:hypothetical protein B0H14DRAFT_2726777, partial [Mycena olivaceomarginata]